MTNPASISLTESLHGTPSMDMDTGLMCFSLVLGVLGISCQPSTVRHRVGATGKFIVRDILEAASLMGAEASHRQYTCAQLAKASPPVILLMKDGRFLMFTGMAQDKFVLRIPMVTEPMAVSEAELIAQWAGDTILMRKAGADPASIGEGSKFGFSWFLPALLKYRFYLGQALLASLFLQLFALITPLFTMVIIDKVLSTRGISTLNVLVFGLVALAVFDLLLGGLRRYLFSHTTNRIDAALAAGLFRHLLQLPLSFFTSRQTGDTIARVREIETIRGFLTGPALIAVIDFVFAFVFLGVMLLFSPFLTAIVIGSIFLFLLLYAAVAPALKARLHRKFGAQADGQSFLVETVSEIETIKSLALEPRLQRNWEQHLVSQTQSNFTTENLSGVIGQIASFINKMTVAATLWLGAQAVINGDMTAGQLIAFNMMVGRVIAPAMRIAQLFQQLQQVRVAVARVGEILNARPEPGSSGRQSLPSLKGHVQFEAVSFRYSGDGPTVLQDINLDIPEGQIVGIVGTSGSGKSSLMKLLLRLYVPQQGRVLIDGINIAEIDPVWLRRRIGVVMQDTVLLNRTVRENIQMEDGTISMERVEAAAELAGATGFIRSLPKAYDTLLGERGTILSLGQRQRIAIARALINNPRILILDEATSSLDLESELTLQRNLRRICKGRTVFLIAHRLSMLRIADRIITVEGGKIVEDDHPQQLLGKTGRFAQLSALQTQQVPA
ncbi:MAG: type I secretion system permease/ATPase [Alphaproteobacteria bacterium]